MLIRGSSQKILLAVACQDYLIFLFALARIVILFSVCEVLGLSALHFYSQLRRDGDRGGSRWCAGYAPAKPEVMKVGWI